MSKNGIKMCLSLPFYTIEVPKDFFVPFIEFPFDILMFLRKEKNSSTIGTISPPTIHKIMKRRVMKPHQFKLEWRIFGSKYLDSRKINWPMMRIYPIHNFWRENKGSTNLEERNQESIQMFRNSFNSKPSIIPSKDHIIAWLNIKHMQNINILVKKIKWQLHSSQSTPLLLKT